MNEENNQASKKQGQEPEFSDIPILGNPSAHNKAESRGADTSSSDPLSSYTNMLKSDTATSEFSSENTETSVCSEHETVPIPPSDDTFESEESEESDGDDILSAEFLKKQRRKWEKTAHKRKKGDWNYKKIVVFLALLVLLLLGAVFGVFMLLFSEEQSQPQPQKAPKTKPVVAKTKEKKKSEDSKAAAKASGEDKQKKAKSPSGLNGKLASVEKGKDKKKELSPPAKLKKKTYSEFISILKPLIAKNKDEEIEKQCLAVLSDQGEDSTLQIKIQAYLLTHSDASIVHEIYKQWIKNKPDSALANYLYAKTLGSSKLAIEHYRKSIELNPKLYMSYFSIASIFAGERDWVKVAEAYSDLLKQNPTDSKCRRLLAQAKIRDGKGKEAVEEYEEYLRGKKLSSAEMALKLIKLAQSLPKAGMAKKCLGEIKKDKALADEYQYYSVRQKAIYGKLSLTDFKEWYPKPLKEFHVIYLLSNDRTKKVKFLPTAPAEFPDFWKVFLGWKANLGSWKVQAKQIEEKYKNKKDKTRGIIAALWLESISPKEALAEIKACPPESDSLFYFMMAEYYRKKKKKKKAKQFYIKALSKNGNIYKSLIKHYRKKL